MLKFVNTGIVFQEIPDEVTLSINISNCPNHCPGCHSKYLWNDIGEPLNEGAIDELIRNFGNDITCLCFMGGDVEPIEVVRLAKYIHTTYKCYKVGWYSGKIRLPNTINRENFDYIKIGPYIAHLGALKSPTTNQRLYRRVSQKEFEDITYLFWRK